MHSSPSQSKVVKHVIFLCSAEIAISSRAKHVSMGKVGTCVSGSILVVSYNVICKLAISTILCSVDLYYHVQLQGLRQTVVHTGPYNSIRTYLQTCNICNL